MVSLEDINRITEETNIKKAQVDKVFKYIKNPAKGNCLFESIAQIFGDIKGHVEIRKRVCDFYTDFDETAEYPDNSVEQMLSFSLLADPDDEDEEEEDEEERTVTLHKTHICEDAQWANLSDIYAVCILYSTNIMLFKLESNKEYRVVPVLNPASNEYIHIRHVHGNHYEAMIPKEYTASVATTPKKGGRVSHKKRSLYTVKLTKKKRRCLSSKKNTRKYI
jgi:hypothetical protein